ncbi:TPA: fimbrial protein [Serratia fonticola]|jgi:type 1 fimbria pilin|uniref:fimbrial protein n=1 Tax=Serratia fonticola TaxID=47917 RepID=UPI002177ED49|nr:fimbrial protein [Serratia fonticola]CAI0831704.1 P pilus assembly protein, pilin FimA [Serratia fonticola]CAI0993131.1 P pilus assembly protein, pilin FimA [Serratia fonticola]CAI1572888.1 P pilus assembly protein, pilin FimA [Serratia fonticola]CAI1705678.1 P pilus assembly protein, pilin FimA [Serratia fonticola]CAI1762634.1 P pilus assembly protein, pilin FimA [Serratia fonticola]
MNKRALGMMVASVLACATATAVPVANLKINGDIKPPTCTVNGGEQADLIYNLGAVSPSLIHQSKGYNALPGAKNNLTVDCDAATYLTFKATDNYLNPFIQVASMNSSKKSSTFNLVDASSADKTVGGVSYRWESVEADGATVYISRANDGTDDVAYTDGRQLVRGATNGWTKTQQKYVEPSELNLVSAKTFSTDIYTFNGIIENWSGTYILPKDELDKQGVDISNGVDYTSNVTLTFNFGI